MALELSTTKSTAIAADYDTLVAHLAELRADMSKLASSVGSAIGEGRQTLASDVSSGINQAARYASKQGQNADVKLENAVAANPYAAVMIAVGAGLLLGAMTRR